MAGQPFQLKRYHSCLPPTPPHPGPLLRQVEPKNLTHAGPSCFLLDVVCSTVDTERIGSKSTNAKRANTRRCSRGIMIRESCSKPAEDGVASGQTVSACSASRTASKLAMFSTSQITYGMLSQRFVPSNPPLLGVIALAVPIVGWNASARR